MRQQVPRKAYLAEQDGNPRVFDSSVRLFAGQSGFKGNKMNEAAVPTFPAFFDENPADFLRGHRMQYLMINAIARRVRQLQLGERAQALPANGNREPVYIAIEEFLQDKLDVSPKAAIEEFEQPEEQPLDVAADYDDLGLGDDFGSEEV